MLSPAAAKSLNITKFTGIYVNSVELNSPAARAGVLSGDVIVDINDSNIPTDMPLLYSLYTYHTGDSINLLVYRNKDYKKLSVQLVQGK
ncbi:MAG: PDZ domain-containing protein [bacterium]